MSVPSINTWPEIFRPSIKSFIRLSTRKNVLFPQPEGPISAVTHFCGTDIEMSNNAWTVP